MSPFRCRTCSLRKTCRKHFKDVASAREDKQRLINIAEAYRQDILPKAQGTAAEIVNKAEAYKQTRIAHAEGETARFLAVLAEYEKRRTSRKNVCSMKVWKKCSATRKWKKWFCPMKEQTKSCLSFLWEAALLPAWKKLCQIPLRKTFFPATFPKTPRSKLQIPPALTQEVHVNE